MIFLLLFLNTLIVSLLLYFSIFLLDFILGKEPFNCINNVSIIVFTGIWIVVSLIIAFSAWMKARLLRKGCEKIAEDFEAVQVYNNTTELKEKRVLNIVQEIAILSGLPIPRVYLIREPGINSFVAGHEPSNTGIFLTDGALDKLTRNELMAVIGHEFGHLHNGDMKTNMFIVCILHGFLVIHLIGKNSAIVNVFLSGFMIVTGYFGVLLGRMLKSALNRDREFLADSYSLKCLGNRDALISALKKINGLITKGKIYHPAAEQYNHFFFTEGIGGIMFDKLLTTHPSLNKRIKYLDPSSTCDYIDYNQYSSDAEGYCLGFSYWNSANYHDTETTVHNKYVHLSYADYFHDIIPPKLLKLTQNPYEARLCIFFLLIMQRDPKKKLAEIRTFVDYLEYEKLNDLISEFPELNPEYKIPLIELSLTSLYLLTESQYDTFRDILVSIISDDNLIDLFEFMIMSLVIRRCDTNFKNCLKSRTISSLESIRNQLSILVSKLAVSCSSDKDEARKIFASCREKFFRDLELEFVENISYKLLESSLNVLHKSSENIKKTIIESTQYIILSDSAVSIEEIELFRIIGDYLDVTVPIFRISQANNIPGILAN